MFNEKKKLRIIFSIGQLFEFIIHQ